MLGDVGGRLRICAISDLHGYLPEIPKCDLLLIAGDVCPTRRARQQLVWLETRFKFWLRKQTVPVVGIAGNHDWPFQEWPEMVQELNLPWTYLQDSSTTIEGLKIYGTPWSKQYFDWAFMVEEHQLAGKWNMIPDDTDILVVHGPPKYYGDMVIRGSNEGSESLTWRIQQVRPKLAVFGHIHEGRGEWDYNGTRLANVTLMGKTMPRRHESGAYDPWVYELKA